MMDSFHHGNKLLPIYLITLCFFLQYSPRCNSVILINEINANNPGTDTKEFIELYNTGNTQVSLDEYTIVLYNGRGNIAYAIVPLLNGVIQPEGYYVLGNANVQPDRLLTDVDGDGFNILQNGPDAVALYRGNTSMFTNAMLVSNSSLVDAVVYDSSRRGRHDRGLTEVLTPGERTLHEFGGHIEGQDESISRCNGTEPRKLWQFRLAPLSPGRVNNCTFIPPTEPPVTTPPRITPSLISEDEFPSVVINEFDMDTQFIELYDGGVGRTALDNLILVFYSGTTSTAYTNPLNLNGFVTNDEGYFLIASRRFQTPPDFWLPNSIASVGINAIALYVEQSNNIMEGSAVTSRNMVDVVVYGSSPQPQNNYLVSILSAGQAPLLEDSSYSYSSSSSSSSAQGAVSLSRCRGWKRVMPQSFRTTSATPGLDNLCELPEIVINEVNAAAEEDARDEFIELFDGGLGRQSLDGIILVAYNGRYDKAYRSYDLTGYMTDEHGFAVLGFVNHSFVSIPVETNPRRGFIQAGPDAVALHLGPPARFQRGSAPTSYNLIDAIIYGTQDIPDLTLQHALLPLQSMPNELLGISDIDHSVSRCVCCQRLNASAFGVGPVTPGLMNSGCTRNQTTVIETLEHYQNIIRINEVHLTRAGLRQGEYLELYDGGLGNVPLDGLVVVIYNGNGDDRSTTLLYLDGYATDSRGFFVVGSAYMTPRPQYSLTTRAKLFPGTSGGVAIYKVSPGNVPSFVTQSVTSRGGLVDAMVFGNAEIDFMLIEALSPGNIPITMENVADETSIVRCFSNAALDQLAFVVTQSSPSAPNTCPYPPVVLNEVNVRSQGDSLGEYVEISSLGVPGFPLNDLQVVFWKGLTSKSYKVIRIDGYRTDDNGYFLIGYQGLYSPRPDMTPFNSPRNNIKDGPNAVTLHSTLSGRFRENMRLNNSALIDGVVYYINPDRYSQNLVNIFTPGREPVMESASYSRRDESINRCEDDSGSGWMLAHISPKAHNYCPSRNPELVINEVNLVASRQFIELWDEGAGYTSLDDFVVVLFSEDNLSYWNIPLTDYMTNSMGYFVMGVASVGPRVQFPFADGFLRTQYGAIAVYRASSGNPFSENAPPSTNGLVDAIVYSKESTVNPLSIALTPNSVPVQSSLLQTSGQSLSRCFSHDPQSSDAFAITPQTPQNLNNCPVLPTDVVINEINVEQPRDRSKEFIELYDGGVGNTPLQYLTLVLFNGHKNDKSYMTFDLDKYQTNENGYFLIGSDRVRADVIDIPINTRNKRQAVPELEDYWTTGGLLQDGPDAIALYRAPAGAFPYQTRATPKSLVDAIVYSTGDEDSHSLIDRLMPGHSMVHEDETHLARDESISRCLGMERLNSMVFTLAKPTPGRRNNCTGASEKYENTIFINEVNVDTPGSSNMEFVELYDGGIGYTPLDRLMLVFFNGANQDRSYLEVDLSGKVTTSAGYFVVGTINVNPTPNITIPDNVIQNGPDAVALYRSTTRDFLRGTIATPNNLIDVVVYGPASNPDGTLLAKLAPAQVQVQESLPDDTEDWSLSRCESNQVISMLSFKSAPTTPGSANQCAQSRPALPSDSTQTQDILTQLIINEVYYSNSHPANGGKPLEYVELKGPANTPLDDYTLVTYLPYATNAIKLTDQQTYLDGIVTVATETMVPSPDALLTFSDFIPKGRGAIALYRNMVDDPITSYLPTEGLVDALVFTNDTGVMSNELSDKLMADSGSFYPGDLRSQSEGLSISRCTCCGTRTSSVFTLTPVTLGQANDQCPGRNYSQPVQMRLLNGAYNIWNGNTGLIAELKGQIAEGVNRICQCGFNQNYLTDDTILNGSVIYQANMLAYSGNQSDLLCNSYVRYIQEVEKVKVHGVVYKVDDETAAECFGMPSPIHSGQATNKEAVIIAVSVLAVVLVIGITVALFLLIRQRNLLQYLKEYRDTTRTADGELKIPGRCSLSHLDIFAQQFRQESFANPLYMTSGGDGSSNGGGGGSGGREAATMATIPEVAAPHSSITINTADVEQQQKKRVVAEVKGQKETGGDAKKVEGASPNVRNEMGQIIDEVQKDDNRNEMRVKEDEKEEKIVDTKDTSQILASEKKKKGKKDRSREKQSLDKVLKKLREEDDDESGSGVASKETGGKPNAGVEQKFRRYARF